MFCCNTFNFKKSFIHSPRSYIIDQGHSMSRSWLFKIGFTVFLQAQQLLQMICYPHGIPNQVEGSEPDNKQIIHRILQTLNQWGLRVSLLELQLMFKQATTQTVSLIYMVISYYFQVSNLCIHVQRSVSKWMKTISCMCMYIYINSKRKPLAKAKIRYNSYCMILH